MTMIERAGWSHWIQGISGTDEIRDTNNAEDDKTMIVTKRRVDSIGERVIKSVEREERNM